MNIVYALQDPPETYSKSLFMAGPNPREKSHPNWRKEALEILKSLNYDGVVFVPLPEDGNWTKDYPKTGLENGSSHPRIFQS